MNNDNIHLVLCVGLRRSGSTLHFNIARELLELRYDVENLGYLQEPEFTKKIENILQDNYQTTNKVFLVKAHKISIDTLQKYSGQIAVLHIYRDLRDVFLSCRAKWRLSLSRYLSNTSGLLELYTEIESLPCTLTQRYEDVFEDIENTGVEKVADFLQIKISKREAKKIANNVSLETACKQMTNFTKREKIVVSVNKYIRKLPESFKKIARKTGIKKIMRISVLPTYIQDTKTLLHPDHISANRGQIGTWKQNLTMEEIEKIESTFNSWMKQHFYL